MKEIQTILDKNNMKATQIILKKNVIIILTNDLQKLVFKKKTSDNYKVINYLKQRGFDYIVEPIIKDDIFNIYPYIENIDVIDEQKALDIINLISLLHNKTTIYKEVSIDYFKELYEEIDNKINYIFNYYNDLVSIIEKEIYMSPSNYLLIRNISKLYSCFDFLKRELNNWYDIVKNKKRIRYCIIHNNLNTDHIINHINKNYLINFDNAKLDLPIYDIYTFYKRHCLNFEFKELLRLYENKFKLLEEERLLLFILISIPEKLELINPNQIESCKQINLFLKFLYKNEDLIAPYYETNDEKQNT